MKHIQLTLIGLILVLTGLWAAADSVWFEAFAIFNFRTSMLNYTGILAIGAMNCGSVSQGNRIQVSWLTSVT